MTEIVAEFDRLAEVYDDEVGSYGDDELRAVERALNRSEAVTILDVGVGTGRVSRPLQDLNYEMIGLDVSMRMLLKAKSKGLKNLVLADAKYLPFKDNSFEACILVDVLNCLDDPVAVFNQVVSATKGRIIAIKRKYNREGGLSEPADPKFARLRYRVQRFNSSSWTGFPRSWEREDKIIEIFPPAVKTIVSDRIVETSSESMISRLERGAFRFTCDIPKDELGNIAKELRLEMAGSYFRRRRIREMVVWDTDVFNNATHQEKRAAL